MSELAAVAFVGASLAALVWLGRYVYRAQRARQVRRLAFDHYAEMARLIGDAFVPAMRSLVDAMAEAAEAMKPLAAVLDRGWTL